MYENQLMQLQQQTWNMEQAAMTTENLKNTVSEKMLVKPAPIIALSSNGIGPSGMRDTRPSHRRQSIRRSRTDDRWLLSTL